MCCIDTRPSLVTLHLCMYVCTVFNVILVLLCLSRFRSCPMCPQWRRRLTCPGCRLGWRVTTMCRWPPMSSWPTCGASPRTHSAACATSPAAVAEVAPRLVLVFFCSAKHFLGFSRFVSLRQWHLAETGRVFLLCVSFEEERKDEIPEGEREIERERRWYPSEERDRNWRLEERLTMGAGSHWRTYLSIKGPVRLRVSLSSVWSSLCPACHLLARPKRGGGIPH